jgi:hypothetical protein
MMNALLSPAPVRPTELPPLLLQDRPRIFPVYQWWRYNFDLGVPWLEMGGRASTTILVRRGRITVRRAPLWACKADETSQFETVIRFVERRHAWKNAWSLARLICEANPSRRAVVPIEKQTGIFEISLGRGMADCIDLERH